MSYSVYTAVATEPITLAEAKLHIRASSGSFASDVATTQTIAPASYGVSTVTGAGVDVLGKRAILNFDAGTCGGTVAAKVQESDDNTNWQDFAGGAFTAVTSANDNAVQEIEYTGVKQYVRVLATVTSSACVFGASVVAMFGDATEDSLIGALITTAREYCENVTRRALATQTVELYLDRFPRCNQFELPFPPLQSVTHVKYKDSAGTETTMTANTDYLVDISSAIGRIVLPYAGVWPSFTPYPINPITVRYVCGYYASNTIPKSIKQAMLLLIGHWYNNREAIGDASGPIAFSVHALIDQWRAGWL